MLMPTMYPDYDRAIEDQKGNHVANALVALWRMEMVTAKQSEPWGWTHGHEVTMHRKLPELIKELLLRKGHEFPRNKDNCEPRDEPGQRLRGGGDADTKPPQEGSGSIIDYSHP